MAQCLVGKSNPMQKQKKNFLILQFNRIQNNMSSSLSATTVAGPQKAPHALDRGDFEGANMGKIF